VPSLFIGACLGRCVGGSVRAINASHHFFVHSPDPGVYSMVGAAAVLGGVCRITISLVVIMLELTGGLDYVVPFMLSVLLAKAVGDALNDGIYDQYIVLKEYPFLHEELDVSCTECCHDVMETGLTKIDLRLSPKPADLRVLLRAFTFRGFPVVDGPHLIGYMRRKQVEELLSHMESERSDADVISLPDLLSFTESTVMRMVSSSPITHVHQVFKQLGCTHVFIMGPSSCGTQETLIGILSKKNLLSFLKQGIVKQASDEFCQTLASSWVTNGGENASVQRFCSTEIRWASTAKHIVVNQLVLPLPQEDA